MNQRSLAILIISMVLLTAVAATAVQAQNSTPYGLDWSVFGSGGESAQSNSFVINGSFGQTADSPPQSSSAGYNVTSGFWAGFAPTATANPPTATPDRIYMPRVSK